MPAESTGQRLTGEGERSVRGWNDRNEDAAAELVCSYLVGTSSRLDPGGGSEQLHDFDIHLANGQVPLGKLGA